MAKRLFLLLNLILAYAVALSSPLMATDEVALTGVDMSKAVETVEVVEEEPAYVAPFNYISVAGRVLEVVDVDDTSEDSGRHVNRFRDKFLYGHNSTEVFGVLDAVMVGDTFTVSYNGTQTDYRVQETTIYEKASDTSLSINGIEYKMKTIVKGRGVYDLVLMTCAGESYGNGDASHRLVIYANAI